MSVFPKHINVVNKTAARIPEVFISEVDKPIPKCLWNLHSANEVLNCLSKDEQN